AVAAGRLACGAPGLPSRPPLALLLDLPTGDSAGGPCGPLLPPARMIIPALVDIPIARARDRCCGALRPPSRRLSFVDVPVVRAGRGRRPLHPLAGADRP